MTPTSPETTQLPSRNGHPPTSGTAQIPTVASLRTAQPETIPQTSPEGLLQPPQPVRSQPRHRRPLKQLLLAAGGVGILAAGVGGYHWYQYAAAHEETDNAAVASDVHQISSRIPGTVTQLLVNDNQQVRAGQPLLQLDPRDYQVKLQQAQTALQQAQRQAQVAQSTISVTRQTARSQATQARGSISQAEAAIANARAALVEAQAGVPAAEAELAQVQANLVRAQADYNRYNSLFQQGAIARQQLETARAAYTVALAQQAAAQQAIRQAQARVLEAQQQIATAQAQFAGSQGGLEQSRATELQSRVNQNQLQAAQAAVAQAQASLRAAQLQLDYTRVTAPAAGRVGRRTVQVGQQVQPGTPLMAIVENQPWVVANFKETQLGRIRPGEKAEIRLDAFPGRTFTGTINSLSPGSGAQFALLPPDNATGNFTKIVQRVPVKVTFDASSIRGYESRIVPGLSAVVSVEVK